MLACGLRYESDSLWRSGTLLLRLGEPMRWAPGGIESRAISLDGTVVTGREGSHKVILLCEQDGKRFRLGPTAGITAIGEAMGVPETQ